MSHENCYTCQNDHPFELDEDLINAIHKGEAVFFVGAGISTENSSVFPFSLYEDVSGELGDTSGCSFSALMSKFVLKKSKNDLVQKIIERFEYVESFPDLYMNATRFHAMLSTFPMVTEIITTNWDVFFEKECQAFPFVTDEDIAFWDMPRRKVLKIHGSINNLGSIVATEEDYKKCYEHFEKGILGAQLKTLLAKKTLVFIGYSFGDEEFIRLNTFVEQLLKGYSKSKYIVSPNGKRKEWESLHLKFIPTSGSFFLVKLRAELEKHCNMCPVDMRERIMFALLDAKKVHWQLEKYYWDKEKIPKVIYSLSYQDGIIHAYEKFLTRLASGYAFLLDNYINQIQIYKTLLKDRVEQEKWFDVAYIRGYMDGIHSMIDLSKKSTARPEMFFNIFDCNNFPSIQKFIKSSDVASDPELQKSIMKNFVRIKKKFQIDTGEYIPIHSAFLL